MGRLGHRRERRARLRAGLVVCAISVVAPLAGPAHAAGEPVLESTWPANRAVVRSDLALEITATYDRDLQEPPASSMQLYDRSGFPVPGDARLTGSASATGGRRSIGFFPRRVLNEEASPYSVQVQATAVRTPQDRAPEAGTTQTAFTFSIDDTPPLTPIIVGPHEGSVTPRVSTIHGAGERDTVVTVYEGTNAVGSVRTNSIGNWLIEAELGNGEHTLMARAADAAGNVSGSSTPVTVTVDAIPPAAPVISSPPTGIVLSSSQVTIAGTTEPNAAVAVFENGSLRVTATASSSGDWLATAPFVAGPHSITAVATDTGGNEGVASAPVTFTVDVSGEAPIVSSPLPGATLGRTTVTVAGSTAPGALVRVSEAGATLAETSAGGDGRWTTSITAAEGIHTIAVIAIDGSGKSSPTTVVTFAVDLQAPRAPVVVSPAANAVVKGGTQTFTGTAEPGSKVRVFRGSIMKAMGFASSSGTWSAVSDLGEGLHSLTVTATDTAGNISPATQLSIRVDATRPEAQVTSLAPAIAGEFRLEGRATDDIGVASVVVTFNDAVRGALVGSFAADITPSTGSQTVTWRSAPAALLPGAYTATIIAIDRAGNASHPVRATVVKAG